MTEESDDVVREFLVESNESLDRLDQDLLQLENNPNARETLAQVFRNIHTIKGTCGFLGFGKLEAVAHAGESLLSKLRDGHLKVTPAITTALLRTVDAIRHMVKSIEADGSDGDNAFEPLVAELERLQSGDAAAEPAVSATDVDVVETAAGAEPTRSSVADTSVRVDVGLLDKLMNLVGELVLARNQLLQFTARQEDSAFQGTSQRLNLITAELQEGVMKTRMQPIGNIWNKFPRIVRDLSLACGKKVRLEMQGTETELDRTIIEAMRDPMTHIVRNAVDHGIETPDVRTRAGKAATGRLLMRAYHEGGQVNIEIVDDGGGIDPEKVKAKALARGIVTQEQANRMNARELVQLIFLPGFSTAEKVTNVSGRGVGMDVVKTNIEKIGGAVDIHSQSGQGTTLRIKIPLTLAIIPALIVTTGGDRYAIPQVSLLELVRLEAEQVKGAIDLVFGAPVYRLRGNLLPLVSLSKELRLDDGQGLEQACRTGVNIVVLRADDRQFGLVVDEICDTQEIVVKPLAKQLKGLSIFAGATILGDGRVALILDAVGLGQRAHVVSETSKRGVVDSAAAKSADGARSAEVQAMLLFGVAETGRMAMPLSLVARLEEFDKSVVEQSAGQDVVQYRGQIMPLIYVSEALPGRGQGRKSDATDEKLQVVVHMNQGQGVGLVVDRILDIVEEAIKVERKVSRNGVLGSAVIQNKVTELLDVNSLIKQAEPSLEHLGR